MFFQNSSFLLPNDWAEQLDECCPELAAVLQNKPSTTAASGLSQSFLVLRPLSKQQQEIIDGLLSWGHCEDVTHWIGLRTEGTSKSRTDYTSGPDIFGIARGRTYAVTSLRHNIFDRRLNEQWAAAVWKMPGVVAVMLDEAPAGLNVIIHKLPPTAGMQVASMVLERAQHKVLEAESHAARAVSLAAENDELYQRAQEYFKFSTRRHPKQWMEDAGERAVDTQQAACDAQQVAVTALQHVQFAVAAVAAVTACCRHGGTASRHAARPDSSGAPGSMQLGADNACSRAKEMRSTAMALCEWSPEPPTHICSTNPGSYKAPASAWAAFKKATDMGYKVARAARDSVSRAQDGIWAVEYMLDHARTGYPAASCSSIEGVCRYPPLQDQDVRSAPKRRWLPGWMWF